MQNEHNKIIGLLFGRRMRLLCSLTANFDETATQFFFRDVKMNTNSLLIQKYETVEVFFVEDGWFNATLVAKNFGKDVYEWTRSEDAFNYAVALAKRLNLVDSNIITGMIFEVKNSISLQSKRNVFQEFLKVAGLIKSKRGQPKNGGGTWLHFELKDHFDFWCSRNVTRNNDVLYAILFSNGVVKIGRSTSVERRIKQHINMASCFDLTVKSYFVETKPQITEQDLISFCQKNGILCNGNEYFKNLDYTAVVNFMTKPKIRRKMFLVR